MKKKLSIFLFVGILLNALKAAAQYVYFLKQANITFEKKENVYAILDEQMKNYSDDTWLQQYVETYKKNNPQFKTTEFNLLIQNNKTIYAPTGGDANNNVSYDFSDWLNVAKDNIVYTDFNTHQKVTYKNIFDSKFLITDSIRNIKWKITDELRDIAGFQCRRANAIIMDSIYVVAFYTDQILISGGPESFNGLPGMILGIALPYQHVTWFASKIFINQNTVGVDPSPPSKGKKVSENDYLVELKSQLKDWGNKAQIILRNAMY